MGLQSGWYKWKDLIIGRVEGVISDGEGVICVFMKTGGEDEEIYPNSKFLPIMLVMCHVLWFVSCEVAARKYGSLT